MPAAKVVVNKPLAGLITTTELQFAPDMKRMFALSMLICFAMICACQKQDSAAEAQLAQRKAELDTREKALDEREKAVGEWEKAITKFRAIPSDLQSRRPVVDPEQAKAERERRIQQLPPELQALIRDRSLLNGGTAEKSKGTEDRAVELQRRLEEARRKKMGAITSPNAEVSDTQPTSPSPSPTPE
jgi:predicted  nucleic acid-binding Zn-ribbon protein